MVRLKNTMKNQGFVLYFLKIASVIYILLNNFFLISFSDVHESIIRFLIIRFECQEHKPRYTDTDLNEMYKTGKRGVNLRVTEKHCKHYQT